MIDEAQLLTQFREAKDLDIERLLDEYGTSLAETREMYPQLIEDIKQRQLTTAFPTQPLFFTPSEAAQMGLSLESGWMLKMTPAGEGYTSSFITPSKWEITEDELYISPTGEQYSKADLEALLTPPADGIEATPAPLGIEGLTPEGQVEYQAYQQSGGQLDVVGWVNLRQQQYVETEQIFGKVFPDQSLQEVIDYIQTNPEGFQADMREIGWNTDTEALLRNLMPEITTEDLQDIFGVTAPYVPESAWKDFRDAVFAGGVGMIQNIETFLFANPPQRLSQEQAASWTTSVTPIMPLQIDPKIIGAELAATFPKPNIPYVPEAQYEQLVQQTLEGYLRRREQQRQYWIDHPELAPNPEYLKNPFQNPSLFLTPGYWSYSIGSSLAYSLAVMGTIVGVSAIATPAVGIPAGVLMATMPEAGAMLDQLISMGVPIEEARQKAFLGGLIAGGVEAVSDIPFIGLVFKPLKPVVQPLIKTIQKVTTNAIAKAAITGLTVPQIEGLEEAITQLAQNAILKEYDKTQSLLEGVSQAYIQAVIASLPFGAIGGMASYRTFRTNLSPEVGQKLDDLVTNLQEKGLTEEQAQVQAVNELARDPEIEPDLSKAIEAAQQEYLESQGVKSVEELIPDQGIAGDILNEIKIAEAIRPAAKVTLTPTQYEEGLYAINIEWREGSVGGIVAIPQGDSLFVNRISMHEKGVLTRSLLRTIDAQLIAMAQEKGLRYIKIASKPETIALYSRAGYVQEGGTNIMVKEVAEVPSGIEEIVADLNLLREEKVWLDTFKTKGASIVHIQTKETATIINPPIEYLSSNYQDRAMHIRWADGAEMVVDANDFAPSSLQKQIAEITHAKPIPSFPESPPGMPEGVKKIGDLYIIKDREALKNLTLIEDGAQVKVGKYLIKVKFSEGEKHYDNAGLLSTVEDYSTGKIQDVYVRPAYIDEFLSQVKEIHPDQTIPTTQVGMPEAGLQAGIPGMAAAEIVRPQPTGKVVQAKIDDYLRLREYNAKQVEERIATIKKLLETPGRLPVGQGTKGDLRLELARLYAQQQLAGVEILEDIDFLIREVENELGLRELPGRGQPARKGIARARHPGVPNVFPEYNIRQLEEMRSVYLQAREKLQPTTSVTKAEDVPSLAKTQLTPAQIDKTIELFKQAIIAPNAEMQRASAIELRKHVLAQRARSAKESAEAMIVEGANPEEAIKMAEQMFMSGKLPDVTTDYFDDLTQEMRNVLFGKVYNYWHDKPHGWFELISTFEALTNALLGKSIPRVKGIGTKYFPNGGSAWDRLARVFVGDIEILNALDQGKALRDVIQGVLLESGRGSITLSQETVDWLKTLSTISEEDKLLLTKPLSELTETDVRLIATKWFWQRQNELNTLLAAGTITRQEYQLELAIAKDRVFPHKAMGTVPPAEWAAYNEAFKELPLLTLREKETIVGILKRTGIGAVDIGNFIRANKASCDMSGWRQIMMMAPANPGASYRSEVEAWKALFSQQSAEANWEWVKRQPSFPYYDEMVRQTGQDFLRMLEVPKGTAQWQAAEEFGYLTQERAIPRFTAKVPWIKWSGRAFVTKINTFTILVYNDCLKMALAENEMIASGKIVLPEGEAFNIQKRMNGYGKGIAWMTQRASLGKLREAAPEIGSIAFAPRSWLGRLYAPRLLIDSDPAVRRFAWKNMGTSVGVIGGLVMLGFFLGLWDVEFDRRSADFMNIRIGNLRIDPWAGYKQFFVLYNRLIEGTGIVSVTGKEYEVDPIGTLTNFFRNALAPVPVALVDFLTGKNAVGEKVDVKNFQQWIDRIAPFTVQNILEAYQDNWQHAVIAALPAFFGAGVQTYTGDWSQNWQRIGLPKYPENTGYGITEPIYDLQDFWADTASQFKGVDPATLTASKGFPEYVRSIATALQIVDQLETLPNKKLILMNADPEKGATFMQYYQMWQDRQQIVASGNQEALKAFDSDERTRNAYLGNITQAQYALLVEYHSLPESEKAAFLQNHAELYINPREDWLRSHPKENALLALWGKADVYTSEALSQVSTLSKQLDIPENALVMKDLDAVSELKLKNQSLFNLLEAYGGLDDTLKGPDGLTARDRAINQLYADNPDFREDQRRIEALGVGTQDNPTPDSMVEGWVERGQIADEFGTSSPEMKLWLIDNKEVHRWALENALLSDTGEGWNEDILRLQVNYSADFQKYSDYGDITSALYIPDDGARADARGAMLFDNKGMTSFGVAYYTIHALEKELPESLVPTYVEYYGIRKKEGVDYSSGWYEDDWFLLENPDFYDTMVSLGEWQPKDFTKVPTRQVFSLYQTYNTLPKGDARLDFRAQHLDLDAWLVLAKGYTPVTGR